jgi:hypothetical protein
MPPRRFLARRRLPLNRAGRGSGDRRVRPIYNWIATPALMAERE